MGDLGLPQQSEGALDNTHRCADLSAIGRLPGRSPEVRPVQLVGTIEEVDSHETDPKQDQTGDPWKHVGERWAGIRDELRSKYRDVAGEDGPSEDQVREALNTLGGAAQRLVESVGDAARDPEMRGKLKEVAASLVTALGRTFEDLGDELKRPRAED